MMANSPADILVELEEAVATCPPDRCIRILEGIVQLLTGLDRGATPVAELMRWLLGGVRPAA